MILNSEKKIPKFRFTIINVAITIVEFVIIIYLIFNNITASKSIQNKYDEDFIKYLSLSNDALKLENSPQILKDNRIYLAASYISSAYSLVKYTTYGKENLGYGGMLNNYKYAFINIKLSKLIENNKKFILYMQDILKNPHSRGNIDKFNTYLTKLQENVSNFK